MLDRGADDVPPRAVRRLRPREQRPVVALAAAGGKDDFRRPAAQRAGKLLPRAAEQLRRLAALAVGRAGIAVAFRHRIYRGLGRLGADPGRRGVVKIVFHSIHPFGELL